MRELVSKTRLKFFSSVRFWSGTVVNIITGVRGDEVWSFARFLNAWSLGVGFFYASTYT